MSLSHPIQEQGATSLRVDATHPAREWAERPFYAETVALLNALRNNHPVLLSHAVDQLGVVDIDPNGEVEVVRDDRRFSEMHRPSPSALATEIEITDFRSIRGMVMGSAVAEFVERRTVGGTTSTTRAIASVVWTQAPDGWRSAGFHITPLSALRAA